METTTTKNIEQKCMKHETFILLPFYFVYHFAWFKFLKNVDCSLIGKCDSHRKTSWEPLT